ncbi:hypothetical protein F5Y16DRAFT_406799 [Xylariaceae sp. FL0255]|nr:hypothetical protein F5Y16DRAFT_406799 [Xylariaceae sp. FL0255]
MPSQPDLRAVFLMTLTLITVGLRLYTRRKQGAPFKADEAFAIVSLAIGHDVTPAAGREFSSKGQIAWYVFNTTSIASTKLSALFFYRRIFCVHSTVNFSTGFQCGTHFSALWDGSYDKYCTLSDLVLEDLSISDFILDIIVLALPIPRVLQLHTTLIKKLAVTGVFLTALVGLGAAAARMVEYIMLIDGTEHFNSHDQEGAGTQAIYFAMLEAGVSLIAVNLPTLWFLCVSVKPDSLIRSIRSMLSLPSLGNGRSGNVSAGEGGESAVAVGRPSHASSAKQGSLSNNLEAQLDLADAKSQTELSTLDSKSIYKGSGLGTANEEVEGYWIQD